MNAKARIIIITVTVLLLLCCTHYLGLSAEPINLGLKRGDLISWEGEVRIFFVVYENSSAIHVYDSVAGSDHDIRKFDGKKFKTYKKTDPAYEKMAAIFINQ